MKYNLKSFKKTLGVQNIVGIYFSDNPKFKARHFSDTVCTALARAIFNKEAVIFDNKKNSQLCQGADYFLKLSRESDKEVIETYVKTEKVFCNEKICKDFLKSLPKFPKNLRNKAIIIKPFKLGDKPQVVIILTNPAQTGRILGLLCHHEYKNIIINPGQPLCISLFAPSVTQKAHLNFIDYYDRYYQGKIRGKEIWPEDKLIISLSYDHFIEILRNLSKSPHGTYKPELSPKMVDSFTM